MKIKNRGICPYGIDKFLGLVYNRQVRKRTLLPLFAPATESEPHHVTLGVTWLHLRRTPERFIIRIGANMGSDSRLSLCYIPNINAGRAVEGASPCKNSGCLRGRFVNRPYEYEYGI